jgi:hypothetical protein
LDKITRRERVDADPGTAVAKGFSDKVAERRPREDQT